MNEKYCLNHQQYDQVKSLQSECKVKENEWIIKDGNGAPYDVRNCIKYYDISINKLTEEQMDRMVNVMKDNINIITSKNTSTSQKLNACLKLRLYAPTHHYVPHRDNQIEKNKTE